MPRFALTPRAAQDLNDIWDYTADRWSTEQANRYIRNLQHSMGLLAENPNIGRACDEIARGYQKHTSGSHLIFFRVTEDGIKVIRILHRRMDPDRHL